MTADVSNQVRVFLTRAAEDEAVLHWKDAPDGPFGFHAQQAIEKLFKALLTQLSIEFPYTHDLRYLAAQLRAAGEPLPDCGDIGEINSFAVSHRYGDIPELQALDRPAILATVRLIREHIVARISALSGAPLPPPLQ